MERRGEKLSWIGGWVGAFCWLLVFSIIWMLQGRFLYAAIGEGMFLLALALILVFAPWKKPTTHYWKLMLPLYGVFLIAVAFVVYVFNGFERLADIQYGLWILPCLSPIFILGNKTWRKGEL